MLVILMAECFGTLLYSVPMAGACLPCLILILDPDFK